MTGSVIPFKFNDWTDLNKIIKKNIKDSAAIIIEPARNRIVDKKFIKEIRRLCS